MGLLEDMTDGVPICPQARRDAVPSEAQVTKLTLQSPTGTVFVEVCSAEVGGSQEVSVGTAGCAGSWQPHFFLLPPAARGAAPPLCVVCH